MVEMVFYDIGTCLKFVLDVISEAGFTFYNSKGYGLKTKPSLISATKSQICVFSMGIPYVG